MVVYLAYMHALNAIKTRLERVQKRRLKRIWIYILKEWEWERFCRKERVGDEYVYRS